MRRSDAWCRLSSRTLAALVGALADRPGNGPAHGRTGAAGSARRLRRLRLPGGAPPLPRRASRRRLALAGCWRAADDPQALETTRHRGVGSQSLCIASARPPGPRSVSGVGVARLVLAALRALGPCPGGSLGRPRPGRRHLGRGAREGLGQAGVEGGEEGFGGEPMHRDLYRPLPCVSTAWGPPLTLPLARTAPRGAVLGVAAGVRPCATTHGVLSAPRQRPPRPPRRLVGGPRPARLPHRRAVCVCAWRGARPHPRWASSGGRWRPARVEGRLETGLPAMGQEAVDQRRLRDQRQHLHLRLAARAQP